MEKNSEKNIGALKKKAANISIAEGSAFSIMDGFGLRYITPYAVALQMSNTLIGVLSSLPGLVGNLSQISGSNLMEKFSRKKIVMWSVFFQALMWLPIIGIGAAYFFWNINLLTASIALIVFYTLLITFGAFAGPAWTSWMKDIMPKNLNSYFGKRSRITGAVGLVCMFIAGALLNFFKKQDIFLGFAVIFAVAFIGRGISGYLFTKKYEPQMQREEGYYFSFFQFVKKMAKNNFGRYAIFSAIISFVTAIASPFFAVYMLRDLNFDYISYTSVITSGVVTSLLFLPFWGRFGYKYGDVKLLRICGAFIFVVPFLWALSPFFVSDQASLVIYLILIEGFSGFIWAGFGLASSTFVFHAVSQGRIALCVAYTSILNSFGGFVGALIGGFIYSSSTPIFGLKPILFVFVLSGVLRLVAILIILPKVKEVREVRDLKFNQLKEIFTKLWPKQMHQGTDIRKTGLG